MHSLLNGARFGAVVVVVALALAGCSGNGMSGELSEESTPPRATWTRAEAPPDPQALLRAGDLAVAQVPDSVLIFVENQASDAGTWKAGVVTAEGTEHHLTIGPDGAVVLTGPTAIEDSAADKAKRRANVDGTRLDHHRAVHRVLGAVPGSSITELNLLDVNGTVVWEADVWDGNLAEYDVTIDAASGAVTANRQV